MNGGLLLIHLVRGIMQAGLRPSGTKSHEWRACPPPSGRGIKHARLRPSKTITRERRACPRSSGIWNDVGGTSSVWYEDVRKENLPSSVRNEESSMWDIIRPIRSCVKRELVIVHPVHGINHAGLCPFGMKSRDRSACPRPSDRRK